MMIRQQRRSIFRAAAKAAYFHKAGRPAKECGRGSTVLLVIISNAPCRAESDITRRAIPYSRLDTWVEDRTEPGTLTLARFDKRQLRSVVQE